jgi:hypothetical protein
MKTICFILSLISSKLYGQQFFPIRDTTVQNDGYKIEYKVFEHAVFMTTYKDGKWNGPYKAFYKNGKLWSEDTRVNGKLEGKAVSYTPKGNIASVEEWSASNLMRKTIFYQNTIAEPQKYFFVSEQGFDLIKEGMQVKLDGNTPDSLIEEYPNGSYIWIKGERRLFSGTEEPQYKLIKNSEKPGLYRIESDGKKTFIRPLSKEETK